MVGTSWLMEKLLEIFCNSRTNFTTNLFELVKDFLRKIFPRSWFRSWFLLLDSRKELISNFLFIADWLILGSSALKLSVFKNLARSLILFRVFDSLVDYELAFCANCWSCHSCSSFNMISSFHGWYNCVFPSLVMFLQ